MLSGFTFFWTRFRTTAMNKFFVALFFVFFAGLNQVFSQAITLTPTSNTQQLVQNIVGPGFAVSNVVLNCPNGAIGTFTNVSSNIGLNNGIILTSGSVNICQGPNNSISAGLNNGASGDASLDSMIQATSTATPLPSTYDGCALEFDLIPACDTLKIKYVFASEEYPEYVNKPFNDVFGFFIKGPGFPVLQNIALIPGTNFPVSINNLNASTNSQYYVNNAGGSSIQYDGFSKPLIAKVKVTPCDTFHLKLVIADVVDGIYDSGVLIEGNSIQCSPIAYTDMASSVTGLENCTNINVKFCRTGDTTLPFVIHYNIGGTATNAVDYQYIPDSVVIPANQQCVSFPVLPIIDNITEGQEVITLAYQYGFCPKWDTLKIYLNDPLPFDAGPDVKICFGDSLIIGIPGVTTMSYSWQPPLALSNPNIANPVFSGSGAYSPKYVLTGTSLATGCVFKDSLYAAVSIPPIASFTVGTDYCVNQAVNPLDISTASTGNFISHWYWVFGNGPFDSIQAPLVHYATAGTYTISLEVTDNFGCKNDTAIPVNVWPEPVAHFTVSTACAGDTVFFSNTSVVPTGGILSQSIWNFGDSSPMLINSGTTIGHIFPLTTNSYNVQLIVTSDKGCVNSYQNPVYIYPQPIAGFSTSAVCVYEKMKFINTSITDNSLWNFGDLNTSVLGNPSHLYDTAGTYQVQLIALTNYGCSDTATQTVTVYDIPRFDFWARDSAGCPTFCTFFTSKIAPVSDQIISLNWVFGTGDTGTGDSLEYCYKNKGQYSPMLIATTIHGCRDTVLKSLFINVYPLPMANFNVVNSSELSIYEPIANIQNTSSPDAISWWWNFGDGQTDSVKSPVPHNYLVPMSYTVTLAVENSFGCKDTTWGLVVIPPGQTVYIPNTFTPNGDGHNEGFRAYCSGVYEDADYTMNIFDRWGQKLYTTHNIEDAWNGWYKGDVCQEDVYIYQVLFFTKTDRSLLGRFIGHVNLIR